MAVWKTVSAKFTLEEKQILEKLKTKYELSYNQTLREGADLLFRLLEMTEYYLTIENKTIKKIGKVNEKHNKIAGNEIKEILMNVPVEEQQAQFQKLADGLSEIVSTSNNIFVTDRKRGRKSLKRKRGRPKDLGKTS